MSTQPSFFEAFYKIDLTDENETYEIFNLVLLAMIEASRLKKTPGPEKKKIVIGWINEAITRHPKLSDRTRKTALDVARAIAPLLVEVLYRAAHSPLVQGKCC